MQWRNRGEIVVASYFQFKRLKKKDFGFEMGV